LNVRVRRALPGARDLLPLAAAQPQRYPCLLESVASGGTQARYDILFAFPRAALTLQHGRVRDAQGADLGEHFLAALDDAWRAQRSAEHECDALPFHTGWAVFLGYELAGEIEPRLRLPPAPDAQIPSALALRCAATIVVDRQAQQTVLIADAGDEALFDQMLADLQAGAPAPSVPAAAVVDEDPPQHFLDGVARIHHYLRSGDTFQVNLSREWRARFEEPVDAAALYAALRRANPAPFAGLLQWDGWAVVSSSPERLIEVRDGIAQTRPIAGTRARVAGDDDAARVRELIEHAKERAEHIMLIDLERNDLGRVCVPGSLEVNELMTVESYAHVHHIVSNVRGRLRAGVTPGQAVAAVFPGGTITGCPKVRCMEIIAELEGVGRGAYTGALGYLDHSGALDLNILIRTLSVCGEHVRLRAGAGIVADSDAQRELDETRAKARGLLRALGADA